MQLRLKATNQTWNVPVAEFVEALAQAVRRVTHELESRGVPRNEYVGLNASILDLQRLLPAD